MIIRPINYYYCNIKKSYRLSWYYYTVFITKHCLGDTQYIPKYTIQIVLLTSLYYSN